MKTYYDDQCEVLADHFLRDYKAYTPAARTELAQAIQDAVDDWFAGRTIVGREEEE